jgi:hypothetical protein
MEIYRRRNGGSPACLIERPLLVRGSPASAIAPQKNPLARLEGLCPFPEGSFSFFR